MLFLLQLTLVVSFIFFDALKLNGFFPEDPLFYTMNAGLTLWEFLKKYTVITLDWYRPTSFYAIYQILSPFVQWHNTIAFRAINLTSLALTGMLSATIAKKLFQPLSSLSDSEQASQKNRIGFLTATYFITLPTIFNPGVFVTAFDFLHQLFFLASFYFYICWNQSKSFITYCFSIICFTIGLTCKEVVIILPFFLLFFDFFSHSKEVFLKKCRNLFPFFIIFLIYSSCRVLPLLSSQHNSDSYRVHFVWAYFHRNIIKTLFWVFRFYPKPAGEMLIHSDFITFFLGFLIFLLFIKGFTTKKSNDQTSSMMSSKKFLFLVLLPSLIPIYSSGRPWHFALSGALFGMMLSFSFEASFKKNKNKLAIFFCAILILVGKWNFYQFWEKNKDVLINLSYLLEHPPIPKEKINSETCILILNEKGIDTWYFAFGDLFKYIYLQPKLKILIWQNTSSSDELKQWSTYPSRYCVDFNTKNERWVDATKKCESLAEHESKIKLFNP